MKSKIFKTLAPLALVAFLSGYSATAEEKAKIKIDGPSEFQLVSAAKKETKQNNELSNFKESSDIYTDNADHYFTEKDFEKAIDLYTKAISLNPKNKVAYYHRGEVYFMLGEYNPEYYKKNLEDHLKAISIDPLDTETWRHLAQTYDKLGEYEKAAKIWSKCINILESKDEVIAANRKYCEVASYKEELVSFYLMRAQSQAESGKYKAGLADYEKALKIWPGHKLALMEKKLLGEKIAQETQNKTKGEIK